MRDWESLREYAAAGSAAAFERVVREHADLVFTTCLRELRDRHLAEDVTQVVFLVLARNAGRLREGTVLAGWLFRTACFSCRNARRQERRRRAHELKAAAARNPMPDQHRHAPPGADEWDAIQPLLHDGLARLRPADRDAVLLRHFEGKSLKEVGDALGVSSDAAQVRVSRAMVRLREFLGRRGSLCRWLRSRRSCGRGAWRQRRRRRRSAWQTGFRRAAAASRTPASIV